MLFSAKVEQFLNLVWLLLSAVLVCSWLRREPRPRRSWVPVVALFLLVLLLLPSISMTDDLMAISAPAELEHFLRHHDLWAAHPATSGPSGAWSLLALLLALLPQLVTTAWRRRVCREGHRVVAGLVRCCALRPPPAVRLLASA